MAPPYTLARLADLRANESFLDAHIPAVLLIEGNDGANANVHTGGDTIVHIDVDLMTSIVRMSLAGVMELAV